MPWDDLTSRSDLYIPLPRIGFVSLAVTQHPDGQWKAWSGSGFLPGDFPTREAAKSAAEAEARRVLWAGLKALGAPDIKRAITAWFSPVRQQDTEGLFDLADYEADMRRAFDAGMEPDNGQ